MRLDTSYIKFVCTLQHPKINHCLSMLPLASIFTSNSRTKANVASKLKNAPALRQTKPINGLPSALLLLREAHSALEETLKIVPAKQRRFKKKIEDQSMLLHYYSSNKSIHSGELDCAVDLLLELGLHLPDFLPHDV
jgi:hypothetical protein